MSLRVLGTGSALGSRVVTNDELATFLDTSDEWIRTRTGIQVRHILDGENMTDLATKAAKLALENAGVSPDSIDYVICPTIGGDYIAPSMASLVQAGVGAQCPALDINGGCSGFLYGLEVASAFFAAGKVKRILMVSAEGLSRIADWRDRSTCVLFGDGAGAAVLEAGEDLRYVATSSKGWAEPLYIPYPQGNLPGREVKSEPYLRMDGQEIYKFAVNSIHAGVEKALEETGLRAENIDHLLLHQANLRIIEAARKKLGLPPERVPTNIQETGNISAATIPVLMDKCNREGRFAVGDILVLSGFGAGLTTGTAVLRWSQERR